MMEYIQMWKLCTNNGRERVNRFARGGSRSDRRGARVTGSVLAGRGGVNRMPMGC